MTKVITYGTYDMLHYGHIRLLERAKALGDYLIVAVQDGDNILKTKPNAKILYSTEQRMDMVSALRVVDEVRVYHDVDTFLPTIDFDVFVVGGDQNHEGFHRAIEWCANHGKEIIRLERTPGISSSDVKSQVSKLK